MTCEPHASPRTRVYLRGSALLPALPRQPSLAWPADRLPQRSVLLTPEALPTLPWYPCAVTPLLHGGWQEGEDVECNWGVPEPTRAGGKQKGGREECGKRADSLTSVELAVSVIA